MIDSIDIYRALSDLLKANFTIGVETKDIKNPKPPCFYIKPVSDSFSQTATNYGTTAYSYSIIYFSGAETLEDLLTVKELLKKVIQKKPLRVISYDDNECINDLEINSLDFNLDEDDYILTAILNLDLTQRLEVESDDDVEIMENMELNINSI